jgi:hypothetical protein
VAMSYLNAFSQKYCSQIWHGGEEVGQGCVGRNDLQRDIVHFNAWYYPPHPDAAGGMGVSDDDDLPNAVIG